MARGGVTDSRWTFGAFVVVTGYEDEKMRMTMAGTLVLVGVVLFVAQWVIPEYTDRTAAELYGLREHNGTAHFSMRGIRDMSEAEFNREMGQFLREATDDLNRSRDAATKQALFGMSGGVCTAVGAYLFSRELRRRRLAQKSEPTGNVNP